MYTFVTLARLLHYITCNSQLEVPVNCCSLTSFAVYLLAVLPPCLLQSGYTTGGYSQGFPQAPSYGQGSFNQQGAGYGYTTTQNYAYPQNYDTSAARPGEKHDQGTNRSHLL